MLHVAPHMVHISAEVQALKNQWGQGYMLSALVADFSMSFIEPSLDVNHWNLAACASHSEG